MQQNNLQSLLSKFGKIIRYQVKYLIILKVRRLNYGQIVPEHVVPGQLSTDADIPTNQLSHLI